ncbi:MAG: hypothetical protein AB7D29_07600 [Campylobacterales bacterium]
MTNEELLLLALEDFGSLQKVGDEIGVSKTTLCLIQQGKYKNPEPTYRKLRQKLGYLLDAAVMCPGLKTEIHREVCRKYSEAVRDGKVLGGASFRAVQDVCPYCALSVKNKEKR